MLSFYGLPEDAVTSLDKEVDLPDITQIVPEPEIDWEIKSQITTMINQTK